MIINLRGTSGSGKTTAVKNLLSLGPSTELYKGRQLIGHNVQIAEDCHVVLIGPYKTSCAGCDRLSSQDQICELVKKYAEAGANVVFEGYRVSGSVARYVELAKSLPKQQFVFAFMDTSLKTCIGRLYARRKSNNIKKPLSSDHVVKTFERLQRMPAVLKESGMDVRTVDHKAATETLKEWLTNMIRFPRSFNEHRFPRLEPGRTTVINIRGSNGSGKSSIVFRLLEKFGTTPLLDAAGKIWAYQVHWEPEFYILGRYTTPTGGCDIIRSMDQIDEGVRRLAGKGNVLFEGLLISGMSGRWIRLAQSMPDVKFIFGTLDTPLEKCIKRTIKRRETGGNTNEFDPKNLTLKFNATRSSFIALEKAGMDTRWLSHKKPIHEIIGWFQEGLSKELPIDRLGILAKAVLKASHEWTTEEDRKIAKKVLGGLHA